MTGWHPITLRYLLAIERLNKRTARAEARAIVLEEECAALTAEVVRLAEDNARLRKDCELMALCVPQTRRTAALAPVRDRRRIERGVWPQGVQG